MKPTPIAIADCTISLHGASETFNFSSGAFYCYSNSLNETGRYNLIYPTGIVLPTPPGTNINICVNYPCIACLHVSNKLLLLVLTTFVVVFNLGKWIWEPFLLEALPSNDSRQSVLLAQAYHPFLTSEFFIIQDCFYSTVCKYCSSISVFIIVCCCHWLSWLFAYLYFRLSLIHIYELAYSALTMSRWI